MTRKFFQFIILVLVLLMLFGGPAQVDGAPDLVGVRIPATQEATLTRLTETGNMVIDYGAFLWTVMSPADLNHLETAGVFYHSFDNPYVINLGGQSFDPLFSSPAFEVIWDEKVTTPGPGLHLVQFYGPTKAEWFASLAASGLDVIQYIHPFTYLVWGDLNDLDRSIVQDLIRWSGDFLPAYAVQPENQILSRDPILVRVMIVPQVGLVSTVEAINNQGGLLVGTSSGIDPAFDLATFVLPGDQIPAVASLPGVYNIQPIPTDGGIRGEMSNQINAGNYDASNRAFPGYLAWLMNLGLSGEGVIIANVDDGVDQTHPDLMYRLLPCSGTTCGGTSANPHGTHTAGIMVGDGTSGVTDSLGFLRGLGMAPGANLIEQVFAPTSSQEGGMLTLMTQSYRNKAVISGNSWGSSDSPLGYDLDTRLVDIGVRDADPAADGNQPLTYVLSIMNGYGGTSTQGTPDEAKNVLTIGSTNMHDWRGAQGLRINDLSYNTAHGPALDGRNIPHMVAPGCYVDSTHYPGSGHFLRCGSSMASPHVTGAVALFFERYRDRYGTDPSPALVKSAFLPVAHSLFGNLDANNNILGHPFDSKQGWGRLDAAAVLDPSGPVLYFDQEHLFTKTGQTWSYSLNFSEPLDYLRAMLVWTDAPGHGLGGETPAWVNDLDLSITIDGNTYLGNNFGDDGFSKTGGTPDVRNNTEGIFLDSSPAGRYTITVTAANLAGDGVPNTGTSTDQDFALTIYYSHDEESGDDVWFDYIFPLFYR